MYDKPVKLIFLFNRLEKWNYSEAYASELRKNIEEMFLRYYIKSDTLILFKSSTTRQRVVRLVSAVVGSNNNR